MEIKSQFVYVSKSELYDWFQTGYHCFTENGQHLVQLAQNTRNEDLKIIPKGIAPDTLKCPRFRRSRVTGK